MKCEKIRTKSSSDQIVSDSRIPSIHLWPSLLESSHAEEDPDDEGSEDN
jgi:hypothetical protein